MSQSEFLHEYLYVEDYYFEPLPPPIKDKGEEEPERGFIVIEILT